MSVFSVDGLVSGLSTSQIIQQLMSIERQPQAQLQSKKTGEQNILGVYQTLNTKFAAIGTAAQALNTATGWQVMKAASSSTAVTASASTGASPGTLSFTVTSLAAAHTLVSSGTVADTGTTQVITPGQTVTVNGQAVTVGGTGTLNDVVSAINGNTAAKVTASAVQVAPNQYRLQLTANSTGSAGAFTANLANATGLGGGTTLVQQGTDAVIHVGGAAPNGYDVTSSTNTFTGVLAGVTFSVGQTSATPVTISVQTDSDALAAKVQTLVSAANDALTYIKSQSGYDANTKKGGPLLGDPLVASLQDAITNAVSNAVPGSTLGSDSGAGISLTRDGTFTFDKTAFANAYATNPTAVQKLFVNGTIAAPGNGIAERLQQVAKNATDFSSGSITLAIQGRQSEITSLTNQIADWDVRLAARQQVLQKQFTAMEVALGQLKDQGNWLAGQLANLPQSH